MSLLIQHEGKTIRVDTTERCFFCGDVFHVGHLMTPEGKERRLPDGRPMHGDCLYAYRHPKERWPGNIARLRSKYGLPEQEGGA